MNGLPSSLSNPTAEYMAGVRWIAGHLDELVRAHPNQWVGVYRDALVGANADLGLAAAEAERVAPGEDVAYHFVDDGTLIF
jgi:hypothetical protein